MTLSNAASAQVRLIVAAQIIRLVPGSEGSSRPFSGHSASHSERLFLPQDGHPGHRPWHSAIGADSSRASTPNRPETVEAGSCRSKCRGSACCRGEDQVGSFDRCIACATVINRDCPGGI
jgi:hypothetical protein